MQENSHLRAFLPLLACKSLDETPQCQFEILLTQKAHGDRSNPTPERHGCFPAGAGRAHCVGLQGAGEHREGAGEGLEHQRCLTAPG